MSSTPPQVYWYIQRELRPHHPDPLESNANADTVVIGGGVAGLTVAEMLSSNGHQVILLEKSFCGGGASGKSSGFITPDSELELSDLVRNKGPEEAKRLWKFVSGGVKHLQKNIQQQGIDCDYQVQDSLFIANTAKDIKVVAHEHAARRSLGYASTLYDPSSIRSVIGSNDYVGAVRYPDTFGMNAFLYCQFMRDHLRKKGVKVHEQTPATRLLNDRVEANGLSIHTKNVVVCTDHMLPDLKLVPRDIYHAQTFLSISKPLSDADIRQIFPAEPMMVWDTDLIYQYFRVTGDNRLLFGAASMVYTYDRRERTATEGIRRKMLSYLKKKFPSISIDIEYLWPGLIGVSKDFVPLAARAENNPDLYFIGGAAGIPWAAALGSYIAEKVLHDRSDFDEVLNPHRPYPFVSKLQPITGTPIAFALSHAMVKYLR